MATDTTEARIAPVADPPTKPARSRRRVWATVAMVALVVVLYQLAFGSLGPALMYRSTRAESVTMLGAVTTPEQAAGVVGTLGAVLRTKDGGWVAIRYRDSHGLPWFSCAVAHTSDGQWFESDEHFCGFFANFRAMREQHSWLIGPETPEAERREILRSFRESFGWLLEVEELESVANCGEILRRNSFHDRKP